MKRALLLACIFAFLPALAAAASEDTSKAKDLLDTAEKNMDEMARQGLPVIRYNDTFIVAEQMYEAQAALEKSGGRPSYQLVYEKISELDGIRQNAFKNMDEIKALEAAISQTAGIDKNPVLEIYNEALTDFNSERYEESLKLIDRAYKKISELEATETKVKAFYEATTKGIMSFLGENWKEITVILSAFAVAAAFVYGRAARWLIKRRIRLLEMRRESVRSLIAKAQKEYFDRGKISETSYIIKTKKYSELIRDINRQIPLLKEELAKKEKTRGRAQEKEKTAKTGKPRAQETALRGNPRRGMN